MSKRDKKRKKKKEEEEEEEEDAGSETLKDSMASPGPISEKEKKSGKAESQAKTTKRKFSKTKNETLLSPFTFRRSNDSYSIEKIECTACPVSIDLLGSLETVLGSYKTITVLELTNCNIDGNGIEQISRLLEDGCLKDLNLDMNPNPEENFYLLCKPAYNLLYLSLKLCRISDDGIKKIAEKLKFRDPPENPKLIGLNLSFNCITRIGCEYLAGMLRTNRSLSSLVLTGNRICDDGATAIIQELSMFSLSHSEIIDIRRRRFSALCRKKTDTSLDDIGEVEYPLDKESIRSKGSVFCRGNLQLQHLNFNWNKLTNVTLKRLINCLHYQNYILLQDRSKGLLHVFLEGNRFEKENNEDWEEFSNLLQTRRQTVNLFENFDDINYTVPTEYASLREIS
ncbi:leucine-rich repeat-containing protein 71-like [Prorops nasuta]|uniref:leucine-rich repeat-containing protein 71-like n=1 Tax=Prorops nasuta TaxID=863751 RepID=UPI0034CF8811